MPTPDPKTEYERADVSPKVVAGLAGAFIALVIVTLVALRLAYPQVIGDQGEKGPRKPLPPEPRLQVDDIPDLAVLQQGEERRLSSYGWADRPAGIAHMPVDDAIRTIAEKGLPGWTKADR